MNLFYKIYTYFKDHKVQLVLAVLVVLMSLLYFATKLKFEEDVSKLVPQSEETKTLNKVLNSVDFSDKIIINIASKTVDNPNLITQYADEIIDSIQLHCVDYITSIQGEVSNDDMLSTMDFVYNNLPYFLDEKDYELIANKLQNDSIAETVKNNYKTLISPSGWIAKKSIRKDPFGLSFIALKKLEALKINDNFDIFNGFITTKNRKNLLLFIKPKYPSSETDTNTDFSNKLYQISEELNNKYQKNITSEIYGGTVIAVANATQIKNDIKYTVSIAMSILLLILMFFYKKINIPFLLFIPTVIGALIAIVSLYFIRERISAISLGIGSVLLGITLDYSLHILTHFRKNPDAKQLYKDISKPILMSSITTAVAFLCLLLLKSQALQDLGIFAAISVIAASVFALIIIPVFYKPKPITTKSSTNIIERIASVRYDKSKFFIYGTLLLFILSLFFFNKVTFNNDLNKMNYQTDATLLAEHHLDSILNISSKSVYIVAHGDNLEEVLETNTKITQLLNKLQSNDEIIQYSSIGSLVLSQKAQQQKLAKWNSFWDESRKQNTKDQLIESGLKIGFKPNTYNEFYKLINNDFGTIGLDDYATVKSLLTDEYIGDKPDLKSAVSLVKIKMSQKEKLSQLVKEMPNALLIDRKAISETFISGLKDNFSSLINYSFIAVFLILLLFFRDIELTLLTAAPIALTWFLTLGMMGLFSIQFTIFNVIISTFIFGLGVDYSIFITNALVKDYTNGTKEISTYKVSIILSVITTILGVGVLIFAKHPALKSIASVSLIGILITVLVSFTIQPLLFRYFVVKRADKGFAPLKLRTTIHSFFLLAFYGLGGMLLSVISIVIMPLIPISKKIKFRWLHKTMAKLVTATLYANPFVKKEVINEHNEDFSKPAIIIANHSSSLDTLTFGLITYKLIYLVNDWVYKSPIFGVLAKVAGFYPVSNGVDDSTNHLKEKIKQGYSLMVFPEGKRSFNNKVGRFHKGAFFLQEQLKLDILPVYFHGNAEVMPKNDFIIHDGSLISKIGKRIPYTDDHLTTKQRTRKISDFYKLELLKFRTEIETADYFKKALVSNYHYKNKDIYHFIKNDFAINKAVYLDLNNHIDMKSSILHLADNYGQIDILLISKSIERKVTSFIPNEEKREVAKNCFTTRSRKVTYIDSLSANDIEKKQFNTLLISAKNYNEYIDLINFTNFETIVLVKEIYPVENSLKLGYKLHFKNENIIVLKQS